MIDRICLTQDRTKATIHYESKSVNLTHDKGQVLDLVIFILAPKVSTEVTLGVYLNSLDDTSEIDLNQLEGE